MPHQWIDALLRSIKAPKIIKKCLQRIIPMWATTFSVGKGEKEVQFELQLKRGIFQGDSLSPLLFCLAISPISHVLQQTRGFQCSGLPRPMTHMFFVDDLKIYSVGKLELKGTLKVMAESSAVVGMSLGLRKCGVAHMVNGKLKECGGEMIEGTGEVEEVTETTMYRYLGIEQVFRPGQQAIRKKLRQKFTQRLRSIWTSSLSAKNKVEATNTWGISIFRYYFTTLWWPRTMLKQIDTGTRKILMMNKGHHRCAAIE